MIKLLIINSTLERSGVTNAIYNQCKYMDRSKIDISILTLSKEPSNSRWDDFTKIGVRLFSLNQPRFTGLLFNVARVNEFLANHSVDIVHSFSYRATSMLHKLKWVKKVATLSANLYDNYTDTYGKILGSYFAHKELIGFSKADFKITVSDALYYTYDRYHPDKTILNGADAEFFFQVSNQQKIFLRKKLNLPQDKKIYISVGGLIERKDPATIVKAYNLAPPQDSVLIFLGDGPLRESLDKKLPEILFMGNVVNVNEFLQASDVFISASYSEGLPNTVLEAALCNLQCVLSDIPQHHEIFGQLNDKPCFFKPGDHFELSKCFRIDKTSKQLHSYQTASNMARQYEECYLQLIKGL